MLVEEEQMLVEKLHILGGEQLCILGGEKLCILGGEKLSQKICQRRKNDKYEV